MDRTQKCFTDADLYHCLLFRTPVEVWLEGELEDAGALIEAYSDDVIKIGGVYYLRKLCTIRKKL